MKSIIRQVRLANTLATLCVLMHSLGVPSTAQSVTFDTSAPGGCRNSTDPCVATYHNDSARDGVNPNEITLTWSTVTNLSLLGGQPITVDGLIYAQPLYLTGVTMGGNCSGSNNVVIVATENNTVYAYAVTSSGATQCWVKNLNGSTSEVAIPFTELPSSCI